MTARTLLFTGKGGVGKTTVAASTALRCADGGLRTVVISTDPAHSLADAFDRPLGDDLRPIVPRLWGQQLDAQQLRAPQLRFVLEAVLVMDPSREHVVFDTVLEVASGEYDVRESDGPQPTA